MLWYSGFERRILAKVGVALSGGVDSSVAALILKQQGHEVVGLTLRLGYGASDSCEAGAEVAERIGIPHRVVEAQKDFDQQVIGPMVADYAAGRTPNPCARCNALVKFPLLWLAARDQGCRALATGHYVTVNLTFRYEDRVLSSANEEVIRIRPVLSFRDGKIEKFDELMAGAVAGDTREGKALLTQDAPNVALRTDE